MMQPQMNPDPARIASARRTILLMVFLALLAGSVAAQASLFVTSAPLGAEVTINGAAYGSTPLLLRDLEPGTFEVTVFKAGHLPASELIELAAGAVGAVELRPEPNAFVGSFSADRTIVNGEVFSRQESTLELPAGVYELNADGSSLRLTPVYPNEGTLGAARLVTIAGGFAAILSTTEDLLIQDGQAYFTSYLPSPATMTMWTIAAAAAGFWLALEAEKADYNERMEIRRFAGELTAAQAEQFFLDGQAALEAGSLSDALTNYTRVVAEGGDSEYLPDALYKSAQIYGISGDLDLAARLLELLITDLPAPEVYDRSLRLLADLYVAQGKPELAVERLRAMLFYDPLYQRSDILDEIDAILTGEEAGE